MTVLYAWNRRSIKVPVEIDLSRASSTLGKFATGAKFAGVLDLDFGGGESEGSVAPLQIIARASAARSSCGWDNDAILSRSCLLVLQSELPFDSFFALLTSCET